jgi:hypothetical protein
MNCDYTIENKIDEFEIEIYSHQFNLDKNKNIDSITETRSISILN